MSESGDTRHQQHSHPEHVTSDDRDGARNEARRWVRRKRQAVQQVGGALGLACLVTVALRYAVGQIRHGVLPEVAATHGYVLSFRIAAALLAVAGALVVLLLERGVTAQPRTPVAELTPDPSPTAPTRTPAAP